MSRLIGVRRTAYHPSTDGSGVGSFGLASVEAVGHPPIPDGVIGLLVDYCHPHRHPSGGEPVIWHHGHTEPWGAVEALHRADRHDTAVELALLLRWTETTYSHAQVDVWELYPAPPASTDGGESRG